MATATDTATGTARATAAAATSTETPTPTPTPSTTVSLSRLPPELRDMVWSACCSPHGRVVELCPQVTDPGLTIPSGSVRVPPSGPLIYRPPRLSLNKARSRAPRTHRPPIVGEVCRDARAVATRGGRWTYGAHGVGIWFNPERDTILLNSEVQWDYVDWMLPYGSVILNETGRFSLLDEIVDEGRRRAEARGEGQGQEEGQAEEGQTEEGQAEEGQTEETAGQEEEEANPPESSEGQDTTEQPVEADPREDNILAFVREAGGGVAVPGESLIRHLLSRNIWPILEYASNSRKVAEDEESNESTAATNTDTNTPKRKLPNPMRGPLMVFWGHTRICMTRAVALESGLFGMWLEEPMFLVPLSDTDTLRRLYRRASAKLDDNDNDNNDNNTTTDSPAVLAALAKIRGSLRVMLYASRQQTYNEEELRKSYLEYRHLNPLTATATAINEALEEMPVLQPAAMFVFVEEKT